MNFLRLDSESSKWDMDLKKLYKAFIELDESKFSNTKNFKPYVPRTHSPGRGLLVNLGLIEQI